MDRKCSQIHMRITIDKTKSLSMISVKYAVEILNNIN